jgi:hypothetical protein
MHREFKIIYVCSVVVVIGGIIDRIVEFFVSLPFTEIKSFSNGLFETDVGTEIAVTKK